MRIGCRLWNRRKRIVGMLLTRLRRVVGIQNRRVVILGVRRLRRRGTVPNSP